MVCLPSSEYGFDSHYPYMCTIALNYYNKISQFFIRKGKKPAMEKIFKNLLSLRVKNNKKSIIPLLENCFYNSMYFIRLKVKTRRRKKHVIYRITYLEEKDYEKRGLISFGKNTNSIAKKSQPFALTLDQEIESLATNKLHPVRVLRDNVHKTAFKFTPKR